MAILRGEEPFAAPEPDFVMQAGDYLVVVGTARGIEGVVELLTHWMSAYLNRSHRIGGRDPRARGARTSRGAHGDPDDPALPVAGLAFGEGGIVPLVVADQFIEVGAQIGLILLLFLLGLEYTAQELISTVRTRAPIGVLDLVLNLSPGFIAGLLLGWDVNTAVLLGGVTYVTSSGIVAKLLHDFGRAGNRETPIVLSLLVMEDLAMAVYLPLLAGCSRAEARWGAWSRSLAP